MKGYYSRLSIVVGEACLVGVLFWGINTGWLVGDAQQAQQQGAQSNAGQQSNAGAQQDGKSQPEDVEFEEVK